MEHEDAFETYLTSMQCAHQAIRAGVNNILQKATTVMTDQDIRNFLRYCSAFVKAIQTHQTSEDTFLFSQYFATSPTINIITPFVNDHANNSTLLAQLDQHTRTGRRDPSRYDPPSLVKMVQALRELLLPNLAAEEDAITVASLQQHFTEDEIREVNRGAEKLAFANGGVAAVFLWTHLSEEERAWPPLTAVSRVVGPVWYLRHRSWWKFTPFKL